MLLRVQAACPPMLGHNREIFWLASAQPQHQPALSPNRAEVCGAPATWWLGHLNFAECWWTLTGPDASLSSVGACLQLAACGCACGCNPSLPPSLTQQMLLD